MGRCQLLPDAVTCLRTRQQLVRCSVCLWSASNLGMEHLVGSSAPAMQGAAGASQNLAG